MKKNKNLIKDIKKPKSSITNDSQKSVGLKKDNSNVMWGGRFDTGPSSIMEEINSSIHFDWRLYQEDIECSRAHVKMLAANGIISKLEAKKISTGLNKIETEIKSGLFSYDKGLEDIHMNIEARLFNLIGETAGRLHTARSRNDQVATDFKVWVRKAIDRTLKELLELKTALIKQAERHTSSVMPGFTHLQTAQPITLGHHFLSYLEMFERDRTRFQDARKRLNECPLGSAALAGTSFPIDREFTAKELGFDRPTRNSLDSVSDRDFALEALAASSICSSHLSRLGEELVIWSSSQFSFIQLSDRFSTGSSIMPQKKNPDAAELIRGKSGRITGNFLSLLTSMKGLSLAYSKDMQEDKEPVFDTFDTLSLCIRAATGMISDISINTEVMLANAGSGNATATELADWLVKNLNIPFRQAHFITGKVVKAADRLNKNLWDLPLSELQNIEPLITAEALKVLIPKNAVHARNSYGGTAPKQVQLQIKKAKERLL